MKRVAIFIDNLNVGGIQKSTVNMLKNLDTNKYLVDLYIYDTEQFYEIPKNVNLIKMAKPNKFLKFIPFNFAQKIYKPTFENEYDVSIDFDSYQMHTAIGALKCKSKKKVIWVHNDIQIKLKEEFKYRILYFFFKKKYKLFDEYVAVSKGAIDSFKEVIDYDDKIYTVIPNYIDTDEIKSKMEEESNLKVDKNTLNIVSVGRLCHQKGYDIMLEKIKELKEYRNDFHLYLIGDGPDKEMLIELSDKYKIKDYITFLGNQKNPFKYLKEMDLFYLSSRYEGQGMVILEAKSVGLDIIIPKHLEKYCPEVTGSNDVLEYLKNYTKKENKKEFNDLSSYNNEITNKLNNLLEINEGK